MHTHQRFVVIALLACAHASCSANPASPVPNAQGGAGGMESSSSQASSSSTSSSSSSNASSSSAGGNGGMGGMAGTGGGGMGGGLPAVSGIDFDVVRRPTMKNWISIAGTATGDLNGDGFTDTVFSAGAKSEILVMLGDGQGSFLPDVLLPAPSMQAIALGDVNADGKSDLVGRLGGLGGVQTLLGNGDGTFQAPVMSAVSGGFGPWLLLNDFTGDGHVDLLVGGSSTNFYIHRGDGTGAFASTIQFPFTGTWVLAVADFDGNALPDIIAINTDPVADQVRVFLAQPGGMFGTPTLFTLGTLDGIPSGTAVVDLVVEDLTSDGIPDLAITDTRSLTLLRGSATGDLTLIKRMVAGPGPSSITGGDWNGDGKRDLAIGSSSEAIFSIYLGDGQGNLAPSRVYTAEFMGGVHTAQLDPDGAQDLLINAPTFLIARGRGDGTFHAAPAVTGPKDIKTAAIGDWDKDGIPDIVAGYGTNNAIATFRGLGNLQFDAAVSYPVGVPVEDVIPHDINGDGHTDFVFATPNEGKLGVMLGDASGGFGAPALFDGGSSIALADFNGDAAVDIAAGRWNDVRILLNDKNGSFLPAVAYPAGPLVGITSIVAADYNGDGTVDVVVGDWETSDVRLLAGKGDGSLLAPAVIYAAPGRVMDVFSGDFTSDGRLDVAFSCTGNGGFVGILAGGNDGTFGFPKTAPHSIGQTRNIALADFNTDGQLDVHLGDSVFRGLGNGAFDTSLRFAGLTTRLAAGDLVGNARADVLTLHPSSANLGFIGIWENISK